MPVRAILTGLPEMGELQFVYKNGTYSKVLEYNDLPLLHELRGTIFYIPPKLANGLLGNYSFKVTDGVHESEEVVIPLIYAAVNQAPWASSGLFRVMDMEQTFIDIPAAEPEGEALSIVLLEVPEELLIFNEVFGGFGRHITLYI